MHVNWKKIVIIFLDVVIAVYLVVSMTSFGMPVESARLCEKVSINIEDQMTNGFLDANEIKHRLELNSLYPIEKPLKYVNPRSIEDMLLSSAFVKTAECYKTEDGQVVISLTQLTPVVRIKGADGSDYYIDDHSNIMPNTRYACDVIIATGNINKWYAQRYLAPLAKDIMSNDLWKNLIVQINVTPDKGIELVPRIGNHIIYIGQLPGAKEKDAREKMIADYITTKMDRLVKFYKYGLSKAGWNRYSYINVEFDNQIICRKSMETLLAEAHTNELAREAANRALAQQREEQKKRQEASQGVNASTTEADHHSIEAEKTKAQDSKAEAKQSDKKSKSEAKSLDKKGKNEAKSSGKKSTSDSKSAGKKSKTNKSKNN